MGRYKRLEENKKDSLEKYLSKFDIKDTYGFYEIDDIKEKLKLIKKELEDKYKDKYFKLK